MHFNSFLSRIKCKSALGGNKFSALGTAHNMVVVHVWSHTQTSNPPPPPPPPPLFRSNILWMNHEYETEYLIKQNNISAEKKREDNLSWYLFIRITKTLATCTLPIKTALGIITNPKSKETILIVFVTRQAVLSAVRFCIWKHSSENQFCSTSRSQVRFYNYLLASLIL